MASQSRPLVPSFVALWATKVEDWGVLVLNGQAAYAGRVLRWSLALVISLLGLMGLTATAGAVDGFQSPSRNIGCVISSHALRCDIGKKDWSPPPKPADCSVDWGYGVSLDTHGKAQFICAGDSARLVGPVLSYGETAQRGRFRCKSKVSGMLCVNLRNGHGFFLSRQRVRLF